MPCLQSFYPYYLCRGRGCSKNGKSIPRAKLEGAFEAILRSLQPSANLVAVIKEMFRDIWNEEQGTLDDRRKAMAAEILKTEKSISQLLDRILDSDNKTVIAAYEKRINDFEIQKTILAEKIDALGKPTRPYDELFRTAIEFLVNPWNLWNNGTSEEKRMCQKLTFASSLKYNLQEGFRMTDLSLPFKLLDSFFNEKKCSDRLRRARQPTDFIQIGKSRRFGQTA